MVIVLVAAGVEACRHEKEELWSVTHELYVTQNS